MTWTMVDLHRGKIEAADNGGSMYFIGNQVMCGENLCAIVVYGYAVYACVRRWADRRKNANFCFQAGSPNQIRVYNTRKPWWQHHETKVPMVRISANIGTAYIGKLGTYAHIMQSDLSKLATTPRKTS
jgi:hypothetical protein